MLRKIKKDGLAKTHKNSLEVVNSYCGDLDLIDVWRIKNPEQGRFTWRQKNPEIHCRLDFFFSQKVNAHLAAQSIQTSSLVIRKKRKEKTGT